MKQSQYKTIALPIPQWIKMVRHVGRVKAESPKTRISVSSVLAGLVDEKFPDKKESQ